MAEKKSMESKSTEMKSMEAKKATKEDYDSQVIPLTDFIDRKEALSIVVPPTSDGSLYGDPTNRDDGPRMGWVVTSLLLEKFYNFMNPRWQQAIKNAVIGTIKETDGYGNTSVSMGLAVKHFASSDKNVIFLNCGSGGVKYQFYMRDNETIKVGLEHKPDPKKVGDESQAGPNSLPVADIYTPKVCIDYLRNRYLIVQGIEDSKKKNYCQISQY